MNLSNSRRTELSGLPGLNNVLDWLISRINLVWAEEHDPESGAHTDITAQSITLATLETGATEGNLAGDLIPETTDTYTLGTQRTGLPGTPYLAWQALYLTSRLDWIGTATSAAGNAIASWSTTRTGNNLATLAPVDATQQWTVTSSSGITLLRLGNSITVGGAGVTSGTLIDHLQLTNPAALDAGHYAYSRSVKEGEWAAISFAAGTFTGNNAMTWTVDSGDVAFNRYTVIGKTLIWEFYYQNTSVGGTPSTILQVTIPTGFTFASASHTSPLAVAIDNGAAVSAYVQVVDGTHLGILKTDGTAFAAATDATTVAGTLIASVT